MRLRIDRVRKGAVGIAAVWMLACIGSPSAWPADLLWTNTSSGYWTNAANWNSTIYPGQSASDNAFLTNDIAGSYRVTLDTNPDNTVPSIVISNNAGEAWLAITNCTYTRTAGLSLQQGARLQIDNATVSGVAGGSLKMQGTDPVIHLNSGGQLLSSGSVTLFPTDTSGNTGMVTVLTANKGVWNFANNILIIGRQSVVSNPSCNHLSVNSARLENLYVYLGYSGGSSNSLVVTNGGQVVCGTSSSVGIGNGTGCTSNSILVTGTDSYFDINGRNTYICTGTSGTGNWFRVENGAVTTNSMAAANIYVPYKPNSVGNGFAIVSGAKCFAGPFSIGTYSAAHSNALIVSGSGSLLDLQNSANITVGRSDLTATGNVFRVDGNASVDHVGTLTIYTNNAWEFLEGTVSVSSVTYQGPLFTLGDGVQQVTLNARGGTLNFANSLFISSNATLSGYGSIVGGAVTATNGATLAPSIGNGALTPTNLAWHGGATYVCQFLDAASSAGYGWSLLSATPQLTLSPDGTNFVIRLDSLGSTLDNFSASDNYNFKIVGFSALSGFDVGDFIIDTNSLLLPEPATAPWTLSQIGNGLYILYHGTPDSYSADNTWDPAASGNWLTDGNWLSPPSPSSDAARVLEFGGSGSSAWFSTNDIANPFLLNRLVFSSSSTATNVLDGSPLEFHGGDGGILKTGHGGSYIISNALVLTDTLTLGGLGIGGTITLTSGISGTGALRKEGTWDLVLGASNSFAGPVCVNSQGGALHADSAHGLGTNSLVVSNGTLQVNAANIFTAGESLRTAFITGSGSLWANSSSLTIGTNAMVTVTNSARLTCSALTVANAGTAETPLLVTDGGRVSSSAASYIGNGTSSNAVRLTGADSRWDAGSQNLTVGNGAGVQNNSLTLDAGTVMVGLSVLYSGNGADAQGNVITNAGSITAAGIVVGAGGGVGNGLFVADGQISTPAYWHKIGTGSGARDNWVWVTGPSASWKCTSGPNSIWVGDDSTSNNWLRVDNGALVEIAWNSASSTRARVGGAGGMNNSMIATNGGRLVIKGSGYINIGGAAGACSNSVLVTGSGSVLDCAGQWFNLAPFNNCTGNVLRIENGGAVLNANGSPYICSGGSRDSTANTVIITNGGAMTSGGTLQLSGDWFGISNGVEVIGSSSSWTHSGSLRIAGAYQATASNNTFNSLRVNEGLVSGITTLQLATGLNDRNNYIDISNGGRLYSTGAAVIGNKASARTNWVAVTGPGSLWDLGGANLTVGIANTTNNYLTIDQTGTVSSVGTLIVTSNNLVNLLGGTLGLTSAAVTNGLPVVAGDGNQTFTLNQAAGGTCVFIDGLVITNLATLNSAGTLQGDTTIFGTLAPGLSGIGAMTNSGALTLMTGSTSRFELTAHSTAGSGWDILSANNGIITLAGNLDVRLVGGFTPASTDSFLIMTNTQPSGIAGSFGNLFNGKTLLYLEGEALPFASMSVNVASQSVILSGYAPTAPPKSKFVFR